MQNILGEGPKLENLRGKSEHTCWVTRKVSQGISHGIELWRGEGGVITSREEVGEDTV